ncbi:glycosyltransferase [Clostridium botulinum]
MDNLNNKLNKIKLKIQKLIEIDNLEYANMLIDDYMKKIPNDVEIYSMKAVILLMQENLDKTETVLKQGIAIDSENFDLNYNLGYLYEKKRNLNEAIKHYKKALKNSNTEDEAEGVYKILKNLGVKDSKEEIIENIIKDDKMGSYRSIIEKVDKLDKTESLQKYIGGSSIYKLTVVMTTYNREEFIGCAIKSVLNQTYQDFHFIILDNCSTDNTEQVVKSFNNSRIKYIKNKENIGFVGNINKAFKMCDTEYLIVVHDDDVLKPDLLEKEVSILDNNSKVSIVGTNRTYINEKGYILNDLHSLNKDIILKKYEYIKSGLVLCMPTIMYRMSFINEHKLKYCEYVDLAADTYFQYEVNMLETLIYFIAEPLIYYRIHSNQWSKNPIPCMISRVKFCEKVYLKAKEKKLYWLIQQNYNFLINLMFGKINSFEFDENLLYEYICALKDKEIFKIFADEHKLLINIFMIFYKNEAIQNLIGDNMLAYKNKSRLLLLYKWNKKLIKKEHVSDYLKEEGIKNIAVCGNGLNAYLFIKDCMINEINVKYILSDSSAKVHTDNIDIPIYKINKIKLSRNNIDTLIVVNEKIEYRSLLSNFNSLYERIIFLEDMV